MQHRTGAVLTIEMLFVLPLLLYVGLIIVQSILIHTVYQRVQTAAEGAAELAACGFPLDDIHKEAGVELGYLAKDWETQVEIVDTGGDGVPTPCDDFACVSVRIPMGNASVNYLGLLGGNVDKLHIRSVACKRVRICDDCDDVFDVRRCAGILLGLINDIQQLADDGDLNKGTANSLIVKLEGALNVLCSQCFDDFTEACNKIQAFLNELDTIKPQQGKGRNLTLELLIDLACRACQAIQCICGDDGVTCRSDFAEDGTACTPPIPVPIP